MQGAFEGVDAQNSRVSATQSRPQHTGAITSGTQLFGNFTFGMKWESGYEALATLTVRNTTAAAPAPPPLRSSGTGPRPAARVTARRGGDGR